MSEQVLLPQEFFPEVLANKELLEFAVDLLLDIRDMLGHREQSEHSMDPMLIHRLLEFIMEGQVNKDILRVVPNHLKV